MSRFEQMRANIRRAYEAGRAQVRARRAKNEEKPAEPAPHTPLDTTPSVSHTSTTSFDDSFVSRPLRVGAAWGWRFIVIAVVLWGLIQLIALLAVVVIPLVIALLLTALLGPAVGRLRRAGVQGSLATAIVLVGGIAAVVGTLTLVINAFIDGLPKLTENASEGLTKIQDWLKKGPLHLTDLQLSKAVDQLQELVSANQDTLTTGVIRTASTALEILSGMFLVIFALFFFMRDGRQIWKFSLHFVPRVAQAPLDRAGVAAWRSLTSYVRATVLVAFIDAVGIGIAVWVLDVPLALPLAALVFLTAFIPIIGATLSGAVAVLVALVTNGPITALLVLAAVIAVQQIEGHLLQPLIMGKAVAIHPLAVIVAIAGGLVLGGIVGALIAVPLIAILNTGIRVLANQPRSEVAESIEAAEATP